MIFNILNKPELICLYTFQVLIFKTNKSIYHQSFVSTQFNGYAL